MRDPFERLSRGGRQRAFAAATFATFVLIAVMSAFDLPLRTEAAPQGIVSFELAGTPARAGEILASWSAEARVSAGLSLGLDYLFLLAYSLSIALGCVLLAGLEINRGTRMAALAAPLAWAQLGAAALDVVENAALIRLLLGSEGSLLPAIARACALPKFGLVALGLLYLIGAGLVSLRRARARP
jgi:hypothetical protein